MSNEPESIMINKIKYIPANKKEMAESFDGMRYVIVRTYSAGVFAGYLQKVWVEEGLKSAIIKKARRLWYWDGAASLSQLAMEGVKKPENCKFPVAVESLEVSQVIEIIDCTEDAKESIENVKIWAQ